MTNPFSEQLVQKANDRFSTDSLNMTTAEWVCKNTTLRKQPFSIKDYEFQEKILNDNHPDLNVIKPSQCGLTEIQLRKALAFLIRNRGTSLIFSLPTEEMMSRASRARLKPIISEDKVFNTSEDISNKAVRSTELYQFGQSFMYLVPAIETAATSISADAVFVDEVDLSDQKIISLFSSRLQNSKFKLFQKFSTPSFPSFGSDLNWQASDQFNYMVRCQCCGHWQAPQFNFDFVHLPGLPDVEKLADLSVEHQDRLDFSNSFIKCEKCHKKLDLDSPENREWVASFPSRTESRGYRVTPFVNSNLSVPYIVKQLWAYKKNEYIRGWYNTVLGLPYSDSSIQIPEEDIIACMTTQVTPPNLSDFSNLWVGIDVGQVCHIVIGVGETPEKIDIVSMYQLKVEYLVDHCKELCQKYNIRGCIDRHPYTPTADEIHQVTNGRIIPVEYRGTKDLSIVKDENDNVTHVQVNRTNFLDQFATRFRKRAIKVSGYGDQRRVFIEHLRDMVREETPDKPATWNKLTNNDHLFHAGAFCTIAPRVHTFVESETNYGIKSFLSVAVVEIKDNTPNIIGVSSKRVDSPILNLR